MQGRYGEIPDILTYNYLSRLIDKLFKIIPLKETRSQTINTYIEDLLFELSGNTSVFKDSNYNSKILDIITIVESVRTNDMLHEEYRRLIFKCINTVQQLQEIVINEVNKDEKYMESL